MKKLLLLCFVILSFSAFSQESSQTKIVDINTNPGYYNLEYVTIQGIITQYVEEDEPSTCCYMIKGDFGGNIKINSHIEQPETNKKYEISGTVVINPATLKPYIIEKRRNEIISAADQEEARTSEQI